MAENKNKQQAPWKTWWLGAFGYPGITRITDNLRSTPMNGTWYFYHSKWKKWRYQVETQYTIYIYIYILYCMYIYIPESRWCTVTSRKVKRKGPKRINSTNLKSLLRLDAVLSSESANRWGRLNAVDGWSWWSFHEVSMCYPLDYP